MPRRFSDVLTSAILVGVLAVNEWQHKFRKERGLELILQRNGRVARRTTDFDGAHSNFIM